MTAQSLFRIRGLRYLTRVNRFLLHTGTALELKSISVNPGLTNYYLGEQFNRSMLRVSAHYNSGAIKAVSPELVQISGFDSSGKRRAGGCRKLSGQAGQFPGEYFKRYCPDEPGKSPQRSWRRTRGEPAKNPVTNLAMKRVMNLVTPRTQQLQRLPVVKTPCPSRPAWIKTPKGNRSG